MGLALILLLLITAAYGGAQVVEKTLPNGVKILFKETRGRGIVSGVLFFRGGKHGEVVRGETNLLFTLLLKGSKRFPSSYEVSLPFERFGGYIYTSSGDDFSEIGFSTKREGIREAVEVLRDILTSPLLREADLEREKQNTIVAIRSKRERGMEFAMENLRGLTYRDTPYETSPLGTEEDVAALRREDLLRRMKEVVRGGNLVISIAGDVKIGEILPILEEAFADLLRQPFCAPSTLRTERERTTSSSRCLTAPWGME